MEKHEGLEFKWGKKRGKGGKEKDVQFYESFTYDGVDYALHDCVYMHKQGEPEPYIGKLVKIWGFLDKPKKVVKVQWFFRPIEIAYYLRDSTVRENELFFASGKGPGLANMNPLGAIAGKCDVICISTDSRNPQPSAETLQMADYVFYRTFDVENCTISDQIGDKVGEVGVEFVFNRRESIKNVNVPSDLGIRGQKGTAIACQEALKSAAKQFPYELGNVKTDANGDCMLVIDREINRNAINKRITLNAEGAGSKVGGEKDKVINSSVSCLQIEEKVKLEKSNTDVSLCRENLESIHANDEKHGENLSSREGKLLTSSEVLPSETMSMNSPKSNVLRNETPKTRPRKDFEGSGHAVKLAESSSATMKEQLTGTHLSKDKLKPGHDACLVRKDKTLAKDSCTAEEIPQKKAKLDDSLKISEINKDNTIKKLKERTSDSETKKSSLATPCENKAKSNVGKGELKECRNEKVHKASHDEPSIRTFEDDDTAKVGQIFEVTRRPIVERNNWIKLSWDEKMKTAHDQGKLVLLQNLDPEYTSREVEDIIWHAFREDCTARVVQHTAISDPHSGNAFVIFKTSEAKDKVVRKLNDGCLMLPNKRPLVVCTGFSPKVFEKQTTFMGHLTIDKVRRQREMKDAVSTSHYSQSNTIEYEMAMAWCLLQSRSDRWWAKLYEQQGKELKKLKDDLKSK